MGLSLVPAQHLVYSLMCQFCPLTNMFENPSSIRTNGPPRPPPTQFLCSISIWWCISGENWVAQLECCWAWAKLSCCPKILPCCVVAPTLIRTYLLLTHSLLHGTSGPDTFPSLAAHLASTALGPRGCLHCQHPCPQFVPSSVASLQF